MHHKRNLFLVVTFFLLLLPVLAFAGVSEELFGIDSGNNDGSSTLLKIDISSGASTIVGETGVNEITDIAFSSDGNLYGITFTKLLTINADTAETTVVGNLGISGANALTFGPDGILYAASNNAGEFVKIDTSTGKATLIGYYGAKLASSGDLAFASDGTLYAIARVKHCIEVVCWFGPEQLIKVNTSTGAASIVGNIGHPDVFGLAFDSNDVLYGAANGSQGKIPYLITINTGTGAGNLIGTINNANGLFGLSIYIGGSFEDSDGDGLPDDWELKYFGDLVQNPGDDYDHDELTNLKEYQLGTDPTKWDTDGDGVSDGTEVAQGKNPLDPNDQEPVGPCLTITSVTAKDAETGDVPTSGKPAKVEVAVKNIGDTNFGEGLLMFVNAAIFSVDVKDEECDLWGDDWANNEKLIQAETYPNTVVLNLDPGEQNTLNFDYTFVNACFTNKIRATLVSSGSNFLCSNSGIINGEKSLFRPLPNPDAFQNCFSELTSFVVLPFLQSLNFISGDTAILYKGIEIAGLSEYNIFQSINNKDIGSLGGNIVKYLWNNAVLTLKIGGKAVVSQFLSALKPAWDEFNNRGCGEAIPDIWLWAKEFTTGIVKAIKEFFGYTVWHFMFGSPANIEIVDNQGNKIYVDKSGVVSNTIPDSSGYVINNSTADPIKSVMVLGDGPYTVNIYGTSEGKGLLNITMPKSDGSLISLNYESVPLTAKTRASISLSKESSNYILSVDNNGDSSFDQTIQPNSRISGGAYNFPQTATYKASFSMDVTKASSLTGWLKYYYSRTRMNFVSTGITGVSVSGNTATISGTGTVNGVGGYTFTATITDNAPDSFGITINKPDGSLYYSAPPKSVSGGDLKISLL